MGGKRSAYRVLVGIPEGKKPFGRPRHRQQDIKMDLQEVGWGGTDCIALAQERDRWQVNVNVVMIPLLPQNAGSLPS
jgi:hypothetical protein